MGSERQTDHVLSHIMNIQVGANIGKYSKQERGYGNRKKRWGGIRKEVEKTVEWSGGGESWGKGMYVQGEEVEQGVGE